MSTAANLNTTLITLRHPAGSIRLRVLSDVPLGELMADFLEVTRQPDHDDWVLSPAGGDPDPGQNTLAQLGVDDGAVLCLQEIPGRAPEERHSALTRQPHPSPTHGTTQNADQRPLRDRTARALPVKLSRPARSRAAMRALTGTAAQVPSPPRTCRAPPVLPASPAPHGSRRPAGFAMLGRRPTTGTVWIRR